MSRASASLLGVVLLVGVTVLLAVGLTVAATGFSPRAPAEQVAIEVSATAGSGEVTIEHVAGPPIDVRRLVVRVEIDGEPLANQPPVPFYASAGFNGFPTGPFNPAADPAWTVGETASFRIAGTNDPPLTRGATLTVTLIRSDLPVGRASTTIV